MTQGPFDPLALWRDMLTKWQAGFGEAAGKGLAPAEMARFVNHSLAVSMQMQQTVAAVMGKYFATLSVPTRSDLAAMEARLAKIENQLERLTQQVADTAQKPAKPSRPAEPETPLAKCASPMQPAASRPEPAAAPSAAQPAQAAKPARRTAKKQTQAVA